MASQKPVALIFGAGANIGAALVRRFSQAGYRVATVSRNAADPPVPSADGATLAVRADLSEPTQVPRAFNAVRQLWGASPSVVIWNVANVTATPDSDNIFSVSLSAFDKDLALMVTSPFVAASESFKAWGAEEDAAGKPKAFIMTGNIQPKVVVPLPDFTTIGVAKAGAAYWIGAADLFYKNKGWRYDSPQILSLVQPLILSDSGFSSPRSVRSKGHLWVLRRGLSRTPKCSSAWPRGARTCHLT
jgi:NAD(P)-dependent dehydrogenase (short-subunit alcohol dehydrogenase family)